MDPATSADPPAAAGRPATPARRGPGGRANDPPVLILTSLASGAKHGYALARDIEAFAGVTLGPGTLYGAITRLEERRLIEPVGSDDRRRPYRITPAGETALASAVADMRRIADEGTARLRAAGRVGGAVSVARRALGVDGPAAEGSPA